MEFCFSDRGGKRTKDVKNYSSSQELLRNHFLMRLPSPTQKPSKKTLLSIVLLEPIVIRPVN